MTGIWLDNKNGVRAANPFSNAAAIQGVATYASGDGILAAYYPFTIANSGAIGAPNFGIYLRQGGYVTNAAAGAVSGLNAGVRFAAAGSVANAGLLNGNGASGAGVQLFSGGNVTNQTGGTIKGDYIGVYLKPSGTVLNQAGALVSAVSRGIELEGSGIIDNSGTVISTYAVVARPGSDVTNRAQGQITGGSDGIFLGQVSYTPPIYGGSTTGTVINQGLVTASGAGALANGIVLNVAQAFVSNTGTIIGSAASSTYGLGVALNYGGGLTNIGTIRGNAAGVSAGGNKPHKGPATIANTGTILGVDIGVRLYAGGSIRNSGTISGTAANAHEAVYLARGGTVANYGQIAGGHFAIFSRTSGSVYNSGTIATTLAGGHGILLIGGGLISNASGGTIDAPSDAIAGTFPSSGTITVINAGVISNTGSSTLPAAISPGIGHPTIVTNVSGGLIAGGDSGIDASGNITIFNQGKIITKGGTGKPFGYGLNLSALWILTNSAAGTIVAPTMGLASHNGLNATLVNYGTISGLDATKGRGIYLQFTTGTLKNAAGGYIFGGTYGLLGAGPVTFVNAGKIVGGTKSVNLALGAANRLQVAPGATFTGIVDGGNPVGATAASTLELLLGVATGTLTGLGSQYINFAQTTIDPGASWRLTGRSTLAAGATLTNSGTFEVNNAAFAVLGKIVNNLNIIVDPSSMTVADLEGTGKVTIDTGSTVNTQGTVAAGQTIGFAGGGGELDLDFQDFAGTIKGFQARDKIGLTGVTDATSAGIVNGNTLRVQRSANPAITLTLDPSQDYSGIEFTVDANGAVTTNLGRTLSWTGTGGAAFASAANWNDITDTMVPAQSGPDQTDTVLFNSNLGAVSGIGTAAAIAVGSAGSGVLRMSGGASIAAGSLDAGTGANDIAQIGLTGAGTKLALTGGATVADDGTGVLAVLSGATFAAANLTIGALADSSGAVVVSGAGSMIDLSDALNVGTSLGTGDLTVGPGASVHASVVNLLGGVVLEGGNLDPIVLTVGKGKAAGGTGSIGGDFIVDEGTILASGTKPGKALQVVTGTIAGGGTLTINGTVQKASTFGLLQLANIGTMELMGPVLNAATITFTDNLTPTGTYVVKHSVVDVNFQDVGQTLVLDDIAGFAGTVTAVNPGDQFVITGGTLSNLAASGDTLTVNDSGAGAGTNHVDQIMFNAAVDPTRFNIINNNTIVVACFAEGTRIETVSGTVAVEDLRVGDLVVPADGAAAEPIVWIGQRAVNCAAHPRPESVWPVRVSAGVFGENVPMRDLYLSPDHAVFVNEVLVPVKLLINGTSVAHVKRNRVRYFHVELPRHAVILAEGLAVESYLASGDRANFQQAGEAIRLIPDFAARFAPDAALLWETRGAAPLVMTGAGLEGARQVVMRNAGRCRFRSARPASRTS